jgi:orotate phosphoribosyltransferase
MKTEKRIASYLLQSKAIKLEPTNPFTWASGWKSPIYCDNRKTLSFPEIRSFIRDSFAILITETFGLPDLIAGVATGAIAQGALVADKLGLPFAYVRSSPKSHGLENLIEGVVKPGQKVVVIEDLISTGGSSLKAVNALREAGATVSGMAAIFTYGFPAAEQNFTVNSCKLVTLSNYNSLLELAVEEGYINNDQLHILKAWRNDPENWMQDAKN